MKKIFLALILAFTVVAVNAQDVTNNTWPTSPVLPQPHNWSIGFDVIPVISGLGNLFHSPTNNDSIFSQVQYNLVGLYVKDDKTAYRMILRIAFGSTKYNNLVSDDANPTTQLTDTWTDNTMNVTLGFGIQKNTKGRLRAIYGGEANIILGNHTDNFNYANAFTETDQTPTSTDFTKPQAGGGFATAPTATRPTSITNGFQFGFQLEAFLGVEYFFAPKMSLSAEYGWGFEYASQAEATTTIESWTGGSGGNETLTPNSIGKISAFNVDVINVTSITYHIYF